MFQAKQYQTLTIYHAPGLNRYSELVHGFSSRGNGYSKAPYQGLNLGFTTGDAMETVAKNRTAFATALGILPEQIVSGYQVHGTKIARVTEQDLGRGALYVDSALPDTDGLITNVSGVALMTLYADCVPVLFYDPMARVIGVSHCGWRGTVNRMAAKMALAMMEDYGCNAKDIHVAIGPSISQAQYEVDRTVLAQFAQAFSFSNRLIQYTDADHGKVDLWQANQLQLEEVGVLPANIEISGLCTYQNVDRFYSHRAEHGITGRNAALLMLK